MNFYGFFIALGILVGVFVAEKIRKKLPAVSCQLPVIDLLPWLLIPGIIGARLYHVIDYWEYYSVNPIQIFLVWNGGLGIFGGLIGGCFGLITYSAIASWQEFKEEKLKNYAQYFNILISNFLNLADLAAIGLSIGQAIGRWGNYFNQELYGIPTSLFWAIFIKPENRLSGYEGFTHFHPLFLYESIGCLIIFILLLALITHYSLLITRKKIGLVFFLYLFLYSFFRFWLEFLRPTGWEWNGIRVNQIVSMGMILISSFVIYKKYDKIIF